MDSNNQYEFSAPVRRTSVGRRTHGYVCSPIKCGFQVFRGRYSDCGKCAGNVGTGSVPSRHNLATRLPSGHWFVDNTTSTMSLERGC